MVLFLFEFLIVDWTTPHTTVAGHGVYVCIFQCLPMDLHLSVVCRVSMRVVSTIGHCDKYDRHANLI